MKQVNNKALAVKTYNRLAEPIEEKLYRLALLATSSTARASQIASEALVQVYIRLMEQDLEQVDLQAWMMQTGVVECMRLLRKERSAAARALRLAKHAS
jgi:DNA-directed RNA polymerase specialized sigma24 family protein